MLPSKKTIVDIAERSGATFAQAFLAALTLGHFTDLNAVKLAAIAGGYSVAKYLLVKANAFLGASPAAKPAPTPEPPKV